MKLVLNPTGKAPKRATPGSAAFDIYADLGEEGRKVVIFPQRQEMIHAGFRMQVPNGLAAFLHARSGLGVKGLILANGTGVIDSDYREQVMVCLKNTSPSGQFTITHGDRIAQMVIAPIVLSDFEIVDELDATERTGGFGSTGTA